MEVILLNKKKGEKIMTKKFGFTLAEVLITLGIIGVVAAMTIPNLIANTNSAKFRSQFKKTLSTLNQAGLMAQAQYDFDYAGTDTDCKVTTGGIANPESEMSFCSLLNGTLTGHTFVGSPRNLKRSNSGDTSGESIYSINKSTPGYTFSLGNNYSLTSKVAYQLADGSLVVFPVNARGCTLELGQRISSATLSTSPLNGCIGFIDVNGVTLPNKEVTCGTTSTSGISTRNVETPCTVKNDAKHMTDIFPIVFHDATVEPASDAAKYVLTSAK